LCRIFTESATEGEVNAVNSEHEKNIPNDGWKCDQLEMSTAKKDHAFNKFGTGEEILLNLCTLNF
jgi:insulysin